MKVKKTFSVYVHTSPKGKKYVGQTCQTPERRWQNGNGYKRQPKFYKAICKYGWDNIQHEIVADNLTKDEAAALEQQLIAVFNSMDKRFGYNDSIGGISGVLGHHHSEETRKRISETHKNPSTETRKKMSKRMLGTKNPRARAVEQYTQDGVFIKRWSCVKEAALALGLSSSHISDACRGYTSKHGGFLWKYASESLTGEVKQ